MATATSSRSPLLRMAVRRHLRDHLEGTRFSRGQVTEAMVAVNDDVIDEATDHVSLTAPAGGAFLQWLAAHEEQIAAVVKLILAALGL